MILTYLQSWFDFPSFEFAEELAMKTMDLYNSTRKWELKGHSPNELFQEESKFLKPLPSKSLYGSTQDSNIIDMKTRKKIGRNDPCPCGSGVKYKKCCGK